MFVVRVVDIRSGRVVYATTRSSQDLRLGWTSAPWAAAKLDAEEAEEEAQFWRGVVDDPEVEVSAVSESS